jgi:hypothetical protein
VLNPGTKLGSYEVVSPLGAGGMGEVYRARDTKLGRDVALKVLPQAFAQDPQRMTRFEREARALASLNHPNIAAIYGLEESGSTRALVMELVEGPTLAERLVAPGFGPARADLKVGATTGDAAPGAALKPDEKNIIHRDLKPANIKVKPDGMVKVLDFGLAKALEPEDPAGDISNSPTLSVAATRAGMILGTAAYMSPEQAKGKPVDRRTDIWAFGCVLYEMLAGKRAFAGEDLTETIVAVLKEEPDWSALPRDTPPRIQELVRRCLTKDLKHRLQAIGEARITIEETLSGSTGASPVETHGQDAHATPAGAHRPPLQSALRRALPWAVAFVLAVLAAVGGWLLGRRASVSASPTFHQLTFDRGLIYAARFAPEGRSIYYSAGWNGQPVQLYVTQPSGPESRALDLMDSTLYAVSSSELAVSRGCDDVFTGDCEGTLAVMPLSGGAPREVARNVVSADWGADGRELAVIREVGGRFRVEFPLGKVIYESQTWLNFLRISPRGSRLAFVRYAGNAADAGQAVILSDDGNPIAQSKDFASVEGLAWSPSGKEVWFGASAGIGWANGIHALSLAGKERLLLRLPGMLRLQDVSRDGRVLLSQEVWRSGMRFRNLNQAKERDLSWLDSAFVTDLSPHGRRLAFDEWGETTGASPIAYMQNTDGSAPVELGVGFDPVFPPEGRCVLVALLSPPRLVLMPTGAGVTRKLPSMGLKQFLSLGWMPGGKEVYFAGNDGRGWRMYVQSIKGGAPRAVTPPILPESAAYLESDLVSPDGKVVFARDLSGNGWLYPLAGGKPKAVPGLSPDDLWVDWAADGRSAYVYQNKKTYGQMFRVNMTTGSREPVATLTPDNPAGLTAIAPVRITPDGMYCAYSYDRDLSNLFLVEGVR